MRYRLLGPYWPEYLVAKELRNKGWKVYRNLHCYDWERSQYAEIDVVAVCHEGVIFVEVKSYDGEWESLDHFKRPMWRKVRTGRRVKSPVWQIERARAVFMDSLTGGLFRYSAPVVRPIATYVFLDRGTLINVRDGAVLRAWAQKKVIVAGLEDRVHLPVACAPASTQLIETLDVYRHMYRWRWYYAIENRFWDMHAFLQARTRKHRKKYQ